VKIKKKIHLRIKAQKKGREKKRFIRGRPGSMQKGGKRESHRLLTGLKKEKKKRQKKTLLA